MLNVFNVNDFGNYIRLEVDNVTFPLNTVDYTICDTLSNSR